LIDSYTLIFLVDRLDLYDILNIKFDFIHHSFDHVVEDWLFKLKPVDSIG